MNFTAAWAIKNRDATPSVAAEFAMWVEGNLEYDTLSESWHKFCKHAWKLDKKGK